MRYRLVQAVVVTLILGSCSWGEVTETSEALPAAPPPGAEERAAWEELGLDSYRIEFSIRNLNGMGGTPGDGSFDVSVDVGRVTECRAADVVGGGGGYCDGGVPEPIGFLFSRLAVFDPAHTHVVFDNEWHFPASIEYDEPDVADEEYSIQVHEFEEL